MLMRTSHAVPLPAESRLATFFDAADLADAFAVTLPAHATNDVEAAARAVLDDPALWFRALLACRDAMVTPFGIASSRQMRRELDKRSAARIDFFPILSRDIGELVVGADDRHLDFKASVLLRRDMIDQKRELVVTTVVQCHNPLGHLYIAAIAPFHRLVIRSSLTRAIHKRVLGG